MEDLRNRRETAIWPLQNQLSSHEKIIYFIHIDGLLPDEPYSLEAPLKLRFSLWIRLMISAFCVPLYFRCPFDIQKHPIS